MLKGEKFTVISKNPKPNKNIFLMKRKEHKRLLFNKNISQTQCLDLQKTTERLPTARIGRR
jgi:hypothetical protein